MDRFIGIVGNLKVNSICWTFIQRIVGEAGKEVNQANPIVDTRIQKDGSRVNVVLPPISLAGPVVTIRKFSKKPMTVEKLLEYGSITPEVADFLQKLVRAKYNILSVGEPDPERQHF